VNSIVLGICDTSHLHISAAELVQTSIDGSSGHGARNARSTGFQELVFPKDERIYVVRSQFEAVAMCDGICGAGFYAVTAENTPGIINVVNASVTFAGRNPLVLCIFGGFDVNAIRRASGGAQETSHALLQTLFIPLQDMNPAIPRLKMNRLVGIILRDGLADHVCKCDVEPAHEGDERFAHFTKD